MSVPIDTARLKDPAYLGRVISLLERDPHQAFELTGTPPTPSLNTQRIGFTGSPGVGKSTLIAAVISSFASQGHRIGVIAVDPTSAFSGGAVLGDRLRLTSTDQYNDVFIRSMASRGSMGGVSPAAGKIAEVLALAGYNRILIETVGVGQLGYDIISLADTVVALFSPESGDGIQFLKAGLTEIGDIFAVNKADRPGADLLSKEIMLSLNLQTDAGPATLHHAQARPDNPDLDRPNNARDWEPPVLQLVAKDGTGVDALIDALEAHRKWYGALPNNNARKVGRLANELLFMLGSEVSWLIGQHAQEMLSSCASQITTGELTKVEAIQQLKASLKDWL